MPTDLPRIAPGGLKELGVVNYAISALAGRATRGGKPNLFTTLGRQRALFRGWLHFSGRLMPGGRLPRHESELIILRIATLRDCEYERRHHVRLGLAAGVTPEQLAHLGDLSWSGWTVRELALLTAATQLVQARAIDDAAWSALRAHLGEADSIEFLMLCGQYDALATTLLTLRIEPDESVSDPRASRRRGRRARATVRG